MNNLQGSLPSELAALSSLSELHVYMNNIGGVLPTELGSLTQLSLIDLEVNSFSGPLFFNEFQNTAGSLRYLLGSYNNFDGSIPSWIGNCTGLEVFWAIGNRLTGSIPMETTRLSNLGTFFFDVYTMWFSRFRILPAHSFPDCSIMPYL